MKVKCVSAIALFMIILVVEVDRGTAKTHSRNCGRYSFFDAVTKSCQICSMCKPGTYVKRRCLRAHDTTCKQCPRGYYSASYSRFPVDCARCKQCDLRETLRKCSKTSDTVCGDCPLGTYWSVHRGRCMQCSYCFPDIFVVYTPEKGCQKPGIPFLHQCSEPLWKPYSPPFLIPKVDGTGNKFFVSSDADPHTMTEESTTIDYSNINTTNPNTAFVVTFDADKEQANTQTVTPLPNHSPTVETTEEINLSEFTDYKALMACAVLFCIVLLLLILVLTYKLKRKNSTPFKHKTNNSIVKRKAQDNVHLLSSNDVFA